MTGFCYTRGMKKFFNIFFVVLGVLFLLELLMIAYFFIVDPWNIKPFIFPDKSASSERVITEQGMQESDVSGTQAETSASTGVTPAQAKALETVGIDPKAVAQSFTPEQIVCFEAILGAERVVEIKGGAVPSFSEYNSVKGCL